MHNDKSRLESQVCFLLLSPLPSDCGIVVPAGSHVHFMRKSSGLSVTLNAVRVWVAAGTKPFFLFLVLQSSLHLHRAGEVARATHHRKSQDLHLLSWDPVWPNIPFSPCSHLVHRLGSCFLHSHLPLFYLFVSSKLGAQWKMALILMHAPPHV